MEQIVKKIFYFFCFFLLGYITINSETVLVVKFDNQSVDAENNYIKEIIYEALQAEFYRITGVPERISSTIYEKEILGKISSQKELEFVKSQYNENNEVYVLQPEITAANYKKLKMILLSINFMQKLELYEKREFVRKGMSIDKVFALAGNKGIRYCVYGYFFTLKDEIKIAFKVRDLTSNRQVVVHFSQGSLRADVFDFIKQASRELVSQLVNKKKVIPGEIEKNIKKEQKRFIAEYKKEYYLLLKLGVAYTGIFFSNLENNVFRQNKSNELDITSPVNNHLHSFSPYFNLEFYRSREAHFIGFGIDFHPPIFFSSKNFNVNTIFDMYVSFAFRKQFFFKWGFLFELLMYDKFARNDKLTIRVALLTFGIPFDFSYLPKRFPFMLEAGATFFIPQWPYYSEDNDDDLLPFNITINGKCNRYNYIFPVAPRIGFGVFMKNDLGFFVNYSIKILRTRYETVLKGDNYDDDPYFFGDEFAILNQIRIGVVYKNNVK